MAQLSQRLRLELADALAGDLEALADLLEGCSEPSPMARVMAWRIHHAAVACIWTALGILTWNLRRRLRHECVASRPPE